MDFSSTNSSDSFYKLSASTVSCGNEFPSYIWDTKNISFCFFSIFPDVSENREAREFLAPSPYKRKAIFYTVFSSKSSVYRPLLIVLIKAALKCFFFKWWLKYFNLLILMLVWGVRSASKEKKVYRVLFSITACDNKNFCEAYLK